MSTPTTPTSVSIIRDSIALLGRNRIEIPIVEYGEAELPHDVVRANGTFDLYDDVQTRFDIAYKRKKKRLVIRGGGWIGYIPLNDKYALRIKARVPVLNLEKIISRCAKVHVDVLERYSHVYGDSEDKPQSIYDLMTDHYLNSLEFIWREGLAKTYLRSELQSQHPYGYIYTFRTALNIEKTRKPRAYFSAFVRTANFAPNRIIKSALTRLKVAYRNLETIENQTARIRRIRDASKHLVGVDDASESELDPRSIEHLIEYLPQYRVAYVAALRLAQLIIRCVGISIRESTGQARLPVILVDMAEIFEKYVRQTHAET